MSDIRRFKILSNEYNHEVLKQLTITELEDAAAEIRKRIIEVVANRGGHLASNLGVVELTLAMERVFDAGQDRILWDVGHQSYVHKLLTRRDREFDQLRAFDGISGFPTPETNPEDPMVAGHAGNAISAAVGIATAFRLEKRRDKVIAVVGDGALGCGISLEGLNNIAASHGNLVIILNDNEMSISRNVGALAKHLNRLITDRRYNRMKNAIKKFLGNQWLTRRLSGLTAILKRMILPASFFENLGVRYIGPIDGHNLKDLLTTFEAVREFDYPVLVHVVTRKGRGYAPAEAHPDRFHGIGPFDPATGEKRGTPGPSFSAAAGNALEELARRDPKLVAITAGMTAGTGLTQFAKNFPDRFFDVGIAEEHAVVFAAGLAAAGMRPVVALYSTFLQRAFDCIFHDVCLQGLPVIFAIDRAGAVEDGPTHHGIYDLSFLRELDNLVIMNPADETELRMMFEFAHTRQGPTAIRYPRGGVSFEERVHAPLALGRAEVLAEGRDGTLWALGAEVDTARAVREILAGHHLDYGVVNARFVNPLDTEQLRADLRRGKVAVLEDHMVKGGLFDACREIADGDFAGSIRGFGWRVPPKFGSVKRLREAAGLTPEAIAHNIMLES